MTNQSPRRWQLAAGSALLVVVGLAACGQEPPAGPPATAPSEQAAASDLAATPRGDDAPVIVQGRVDRVIDGDTFELSNGTRVRLAITDTPEVHGGAQTCGPEATAFATGFLAGQTVAVHRPTAAPTTDTYGRTLGEAVRVADGASLNVALVAAGLGRIDDRFTSEDPDLTDRLHAAAATAETPDCQHHSEPEP